MVRAVYSFSQGFSAFISFLIISAFGKSNTSSITTAGDNIPSKNNDTLFTTTSMNIIEYQETFQNSEDNVKDKWFLNLWKLQLSGAIIAFILSLFLKNNPSRQKNLKFSEIEIGSNRNSFESDIPVFKDGEHNSKLTYQRTVKHLKNYLKIIKKNYFGESLKFAPGLIAVQFNMAMLYAYSQMVWLKHDDYNTYKQYNGLVMSLLWISGAIFSLIAGSADKAIIETDKKSYPKSITNSIAKFTQGELILQISLIVQVGLPYIVTLHKLLDSSIIMFYFLFLILFGNGQFLLTSLSNRIIQSLNKNKKRERDLKNKEILQLKHHLHAEGLECGLSPPIKLPQNNSPVNTEANFTIIYAINQYLSFILMFLVLKIAYWIDSDMSTLRVFRITTHITGIGVLLFDILKW